VILLKLGGSLITDKAGAGEARVELVERLAREIAAARPALEGGLIVGHGGGSFGHVAAAASGLNQGVLGPEQLPGIAETQASMARLHAIVFGALHRAGALPFSLAPSSFMTAAAGRPVALRLEPVQLALRMGLLPLVFGDVVLDRAWGASIASTEQVFVALARRLARCGTPIARALWLGETDGVLGADGVTLSRLGAGTALAGEVAGAARGTDVTGGMAHRLETAAELARMGIESWILDGRVPGRLRLALAGEAVPGTIVA
jgi:isopentenyl phosphate kinase